MGQGMRQRPLIGPEVEDGAELPADIVEPLDQPVGDFGVQKPNTAAARRALAVKAPGTPVKQCGRVVLGGRHSVLSPVAG
jgi:hypothetical protein